MLPINNKALKSIAKKMIEYITIPLAGGKMGIKKGPSYKQFWVQNGDVAVYSGRVIAKVTDFSPLPDGVYEFDTGIERSDYLIFDLFNGARKLVHQVRLPLSVVDQLHKSLKTWLNTRVDKTLIPHAQMTFVREGEHSFQILFEAAGSHNHPDLSLDWTVTIDDLELYSDRVFAFNAVEFVDAFSLFSKLSGTQAQVYLRYTQDAKDPVFLLSELDGHEIISGMPFEFMGRVEEKEDPPLIKAINEVGDDDAG